GPCPVEHVFTIRVRLGEERHGAGKRPGAPQNHELREPAAARVCAAGLDQGRKKLVADERLRASQRVPLVGGDPGQRIYDLNAFQGDGDSTVARLRDTITYPGRPA